jgi:uncharacterized membrane protein YkvA (DUF1232 family)
METFALLVGFFVFMILMIPVLQGIAHRKEKEAKLVLMKQHPEHAAEIQKAMDIQETQFQTQVKQAWQLPAPRKKSGGAGKWVVIALCVIYIISPIDAIPDVIPALGWGDDVVAGLIGLRALFK